MRIEDPKSREYIEAQGLRIDNLGMLHLTEQEYKRYEYKGKSVSKSYPGKRLMLFPCSRGKTIYIEGYHFAVDA